MISLISPDTSQLRKQYLWSSSIWSACDISVMRLWGRDWGRGGPLGLLTMARLTSRDDCSAASGYCKLRAPAITGCMESNFLKTTITSEYLQRALNEMLKLATECTDNDDDDHHPGVRAPGGLWASTRAQWRNARVRAGRGIETDFLWLLHFCSELLQHVWVWPILQL